MRAAASSSFWLFSRWIASKIASEVEGICLSFASKK
jgi:hypothetical protein